MNLFGWNENSHAPLPHWNLLFLLLAPNRQKDLCGDCTQSAYMSGMFVAECTEITIINGKAMVVSNDYDYDYDYYY